MSAKKRKKKSTKKYKGSLNSLFIPVIAVIEVIVLVAVSTFAWFFLNENKKLSSGIITVQADSGLEIDFKDADKSSYIDIWDYVDRTDFAFEPCTSVDGRNIYFPTSGTFGSTTTSDMVFRDVTANDVNSKFLKIDFKLTNTFDDRDMQVYLSNNSTFQIRNQNNKRFNGKALRLAFYNNDGNSGNVASNLISNYGGSRPVVEEEEEESGEEEKVYEDAITVYFRNTSNWSNPKAYVWNNTDSSHPHISAWPGDSMVHIAGNLYSYTFNNPYTVSENVKTYYYTHIIFSGNNNSNQTGDIPFTYSGNGGNNNGYVYGPSSTTPLSTSLEQTTVYFLKPSGWNGVKCSAWTGAGGSTVFSSDDYLTEVTTGIYSYTFPTDITALQFSDNGSNSSLKTSFSAASAYESGNLYYFPVADSYGLPAGTLDVLPYSKSSIYFYNTKGWELPYAHVNACPKSNTSGDYTYTYAIPMVALSGNLFYCTVASPYLYDVMDNTTENIATSSTAQSSLAANCKVFFSEKEQSDDTSSRTVPAYCKSEYIYTCGTEKGTSPAYYPLDTTDYSDEVDITADSYAVISPGVSAGFQRASNPVNAIDYTTGAELSIVPSFASSFDDYILGSGHPVFTIEHGETVNMSMIIWLEGTDSHCTGETYAGNDIEVFLEFSTILQGDDSGNTFNYRFVDETLEMWTSNTVTNPKTKVSTNPVMQLYDEEDDRGYLMSPKTYASYYGSSKVKVWQCAAPQSLSTNGHHIQFRRVNPYNEDEVWNCWEAGVLSDYRTYAYDPATKAVTFTAFADGSPSYDIYDRGNDSVFDTPEDSCGGLWGSFDTDYIAVYDDRQSHPINNTDKVLTFSYKYTYNPTAATAEQVSMTIEYKASGYRDPTSSDYFDGFSQIRIPSLLYTNGSSFKFKYYTGVDNGYAINSKLNDSISLEGTWDAGNTINGQFYNLNYAGGNSYWGTDVIYIQIGSSVCANLSDSGSFNQMKYYDNSGHIFYNYLYRNDDFKGSHNGSFVSIVPAPSGGIYYTSYQFESCDINNHNTRNRIGDPYSNMISDSSKTVAKGVTQEYNTVRDDGKIVLLAVDWKKIYYHRADWTDTTLNWPYVKYWGSTSYGSNENVGMTWSGTNNDKGNGVYYCFVPSDCGAQFKWDRNGGTTVSVDISPADGYAYYPKGWTDGKVDVDGKTFSGLAGNIREDTRLHTSCYTNTEQWPQFTQRVFR